MSIWIKASADRQNNIHGITHSSDTSSDTPVVRPRTERRTQTHDREYRRTSNNFTGAKYIDQYHTRHLNNFDKQNKVDTSFHNTNKQHKDTDENIMHIDIDTEHWENLKARKQKQKEQMKQYRADHATELKERQKEYRMNNKEKIRERQKEYRIKNKEKIKENLNVTLECQCGGVFKKGSKYNHMTSNQHINYIERYLRLRKIDQEYKAREEKRKNKTK